MAAKKDVETMNLVREHFKRSEMSLSELGVKMGFAPEIARQSAWQFMQTDDPRLSSLKRFAKAMGLSIRKLV